MSKKRSRESKGKSEGETEEIRCSVLPTATSVLQVQQRAEQEIRHANDVLQERTRPLVAALLPSCVRRGNRLAMRFL